MSQVLRYHVVACQQLLLENLKVTTSAVTLQGEPISISVSQVRAATLGRCCPRPPAAAITANC